jgi:tetratricopeptide (TPR) repeat protein
MKSPVLALPPLLLKTVFILLALFMFCAGQLKAQNPKTDKLRAALLAHPQQDTARVNRLNALAFVIRNSDPPTALKYDKEAIELSKKLGYLKGQGLGELSLAFYYRVDTGSYALSIHYSKLALNHFKAIKDTLNEIACDYNLSSVYTDLGKADEGIIYDFEGLKLAEKKNNEKWMVLVNYHLADRYATMGETIIAKRYIDIAYALAKKSNDNDGIAHCLTGLGFVAEQGGNWAGARSYYLQSTQLAIEMKETRQLYMSMLAVTDMDEHLGKYANVIARVDTCLARFRSMQYPGSIPYAYSVKSRAYLHTGKADSAVKYGLLSFRATEQSGVKNNTRNMSQVLANAYANLNNYKEAYHYQVLFTIYKDSINNVAAIQKVAIAQYANDMEKKQSEIKLLTKNAGLEKLKNNQQEIILIFVVVGFIAAGIFSFVMVISNRQKQQTNKILIKQQDE